MRKQILKNFKAKILTKKEGMSKKSITWQIKHHHICVYIQFLLLKEVYTNVMNVFVRSEIWTHQKFEASPSLG